MTRRITAALLALMLLFTSFPVFASADGTTVYTKGQNISIKKALGNYDPNEAKSTYPVQPGYMWQQKRDENGQRVEACTQPEHFHVKACFQSNPPCDLTPHTHDELGACDPYMGWVWEVVRDPDYTGWDYDPEAPDNYEFAVCCIDPDGVHPMVGVGFALTRPATEEEKAATGNERTSVLENSQSLLTNQRGFAYFDGTCSSYEPAGDATWILTQNTRKFAPEGEYHAAYRPHTVQWQVDVTVNGDGTYTVKNISDPNDSGIAAAAEVPLPEQGYNSALRRLVMLHDLVRVNLYIDGRFVPQGTEAFDVTILGESGFQDTITMENGDQGWHYVYENAAPDIYSVSASLSGYPITYKLGYPNGELTEAENLELNADHSNGIFEIHFGTLSNTVKMYSMYTGEDTAINADIRYGLFAEGDETPVAQFAPAENESEARIGGRDWEALWGTYGVEDGTIQFTLKQIAAPQYHELAAEAYTVTIREAAETAEEPYIVVLEKAAGEEEVRYGTENEQIATFRNQKPDLSHLVTANTYDDAETPNRIPNVTYVLEENGEEIPVEDPAEIDFSVYAGEEKREFILRQKAVPAGYELAEEAYKVTVTMEADKPVVEVAKHENLLARIATFFSGDRIEQDDFGRWLVAFTSKKAEPAVKIINTVQIHSVDEDRNGFTSGTVRYGLYRDTYENGEKPAVEFPNETITQDASGVICITSDDWMDIALENQTLASAADISNLMAGGSIDITLKQSNPPEGYADAVEEYTLTLSKATDDSGDMFKVVLTAAKGDEPVRYGDNGEQLAFFVHESIPVQITNTVEIYSVDQDRNAVADEAVRYGLYRDTYENGEKPAVEFPTEDIVQSNGVIRITSENWMDIAMQNQNLASAADLMALRNGESIDITLKQSNAPANYGDALQEYTLTLSRAASGSEDLFKVVLSAAKGDEPVRYSVTGAQQVYFVHEKLDRSHIVTIKTYDDAEKTNDLSGAGAVYALYENDAEVKTLTSNEIDFSTFEAVDKEYVLKQKTAPEGYKQAAEQYKISLTWADGKPVVTVAKNQNVLQRIAQLFSADGVEQDATGKWITTFISEKIVDTTVRTAKVQLTLEDIQKVWNKDTTKDSEMESQITEMGYTFVLYWKENDTAGWQKYSKQLTLSSGTKSRTGVFDMEIPEGAAYKVMSAEEDALYTVTFKAGSKTGAGAIEGTVTRENTTANNGIIDVTATPRFEFVAGSAPASLTMYKVNARDLSKPLSGAKFALKDEDGIVLKEYTTQKDGAVIIYTNMLNGSSSYTLKETIAPEGYVLMKTAIELDVGYQYTAEDGKAVQDYGIVPIHADVVQGSDGTYYIKNVYESDLPQTGDTFDPILWAGMLMVSTAGLALLLISSKRRRRAAE